MTTSRTDTHSPTNFDPAQYSEVGMFDNHYEDGFFHLDSEYNGKDYFDGNNAKKNRCDHCGSGPLRYGYIFHHGPSDQLVVVGTQCASKLGLSSRSEYDTKKRLEELRREAKVAEFKASSIVNAEIAEFLHSVSITEYIRYAHEGADAEIVDRPFARLFPAVSGHTVAFLSDLDHKLHRYGSLSEKQVAAVVKIKARNDEWLAQRAAQAEAMTQVAPLAEGKQTIEGEIVSTKLIDNDYGSTFKMLVKLDDGNKVWGTMPGSIYSALPVHNGHEWFKGQRVSFSATVERSRDDEHFGFYKRPTKARVVA